METGAQKRILYIANIRLPTEKAHGLQIMKTCEALAQGGAAVELVIPTRHNPLKDNPFSYYGIQECFKITRVQTPDLVQGGPLGFFLSALWFSEKVRWLRAFWAADIIYSRDALVLAQYLLLGRTLVLEAHAAPSWLSMLVARRVHRLVVISQGLRSAYEKRGIPASKSIVAPDAVDEHFFDNIPARAEARVALGLPADARIALYAGHLYPRKGADTFAAAAATMPETLALLVGGTKKDSASFTQRWGAHKNIKIIGHVPHERIPLYLRAADALVLPNSGRDADAARYTSPMKLFEYMASGTPIVASEVPSLREVLGDDAAFFVPADNPQQLAQGIERALREGGEAATRAERALEQVRAYSWRARAAHILSNL